MQAGLHIVFGRVDLYWVFLDWAQAGDDHVLQMMKSSLRLLIMAKNKNQALG